MAAIEFKGYITETGIVLLQDDAGREFQMGIGELVNREDLIGQMSAEDAVRIGSWHAAYMGRVARRFEMHQVEGQSMAPTACDGDLAEIDTSDVRANEGIFLLKFPIGHPALRRLQPRLDGRIRVSSDHNPEIGDECHESELVILGRVTKIWNGKAI